MCDDNIYFLRVYWFHKTQFLHLNNIHSTSTTYIIIALINHLNTGSITKLQNAMGHSSINVSLTYLRGLEVAELTESDMPKF